MLEERPLLTKALTGIVGCALGDLLAQVGLDTGVGVWTRCGPTPFPSGRLVYYGSMLNWRVNQGPLAYHVPCAP